MFGRTEIFAQSTHLPAEFLCWGEGKNACDKVNETASTIGLNSVSCGQFFASYYINKSILPICLMSFSRLLSWRYVDVNILSMDCLDVAET